MDELSDEDQLTVQRARKIQRFLSQPMHVAEKFSSVPGVYVPLKETLRGFKAIVDGEMDQYPEAAFYNVGTLEDVIAKAKQLEAEAICCVHFRCTCLKPIRSFSRASASRLLCPQRSASTAFWRVTAI